MKVNLDLPDRLWAELVDLAEERYTTVAAVVSAAITDALRPSSMAQLEAQARQNHVVQLVKAGMPDAAIAERLGELKYYVATVRRRAGLPANRFRGSSSGTTGRKAS